MPEASTYSDVPSHKRERRRRWGYWVWGGVVALAAGSVLFLVVTGGRLGGEGCDGTTTVVVAASTGHFPVLQALSAEWESAEPTHAGRCLRATVVSEEAGSVAAALGPGWDEARDGQRPDVWVPESSLWLRVAQSRPDVASTLPDQAPSLASSPVVLALRQEMAGALGWPQRELGWEEVIGAILQPDAWAKAGHPEWAAMRLGMTDPTISTVGLASVLSVLDQDGDGTVADAELGATIGFSQTLGGMVPDTSQYFTALGSEPDSASSVAAFPAVERDIAVHNGAKPAVGLVPIYPRQGAIVADYPYAILNWVDEQQREAASQFLQFALGPAGHRAFAAAGFRGSDQTIQNDGALPAEQGFREALQAPRLIPDAAAVSQIMGAWTGLQRPANTLVVLDTSGSMSDPVPGLNLTRLQLMQQTATAGLGMLTNRTSMGLWEFSSRLTPTTDYRVLVPFGPSSASVGSVPRLQAMLASVARLRAKGGTGLYDTTYAAFRAMQAAWQPDTTNVILLITDGRNEYDTGLTLDRLLAQLQREGRPDRPLPIIGVAVGPEADAEALERISQVTGGRTFVVRDPAKAVNTLILAFAGRLR
jgi:Ca-activated chloride channel homolog